MDTPTPTPASPEKKSGGIPLWTVLIGLLVLAMLGAASLGAVLYFTRSDKAKLERQLQAVESQQKRAKIDEAKAAEDAKLALARNRQDEVLASSRNATNQLGRLLQEANAVTSDAIALKSNESGSRIAQHPDLVAQARRLYEVEIPGFASQVDIVSKLEAVRRIEQQLVSALGTTYEPAAELSTTAQTASTWADQELRKVAQARALVSSLIQESKIKVASAPLTSSSPTLEAAIRQMIQTESAAKQQTIVAKTAEAKTEAADTVAKAEAQRILEQAQIQASNIVTQANEEKAQQNRSAVVLQAKSKVEDTKAQVEALQQLDEAQKVKLRQKASKPDVQSTLAPFITPGFWTIAAGSGPYKEIEKKPLSYTAIKGSGALNSTSEGLQTLVKIATYERNDRPKWSDIRKHGDTTTKFLRIPEKITLAKERQALLVELAPVLVEMKLLEP